MHLHLNVLYSHVDLCRCLPLNVCEHAFDTTSTWSMVRWCRMQDCVWIQLNIWKKSSRAHPWALFRIVFSILRIRFSIPLRFWETTCFSAKIGLEEVTGRRPLSCMWLHGDLFRRLQGFRSQGSGWTSQARYGKMHVWNLKYEREREYERDRERIGEREGDEKMRQRNTSFGSP